jgi:hypothetical protein
VIFSLIALGKMSAQPIPGDVSMFVVSDDPTGMRKIDVYWQNFQVPLPSDPLDYTLLVSLFLTTNATITPCIDLSLSQQYLNPAFPVSTLALINPTEIKLEVKKIEELGLNDLLNENGSLYLFSIIFVGTKNSAVFANWQTAPSNPKIRAFNGSVPAGMEWNIATGPTTGKHITSRSITGSIYKPPFTQSDCQGGQNAAVTQVNLIAEPNMICPFPLGQTSITNTNSGNYFFDDLTSQNGPDARLISWFDYKVMPSKTNGRDCGLTGLDASMVNAHVLGTVSFIYPYQMIAADMNLNGIVTGNDAVIITQVINGNFAGLPANWKSWAFVPSSVYGNMPPPSGITVPLYNEFIQFDNLGVNQTIKDFVGIKRGDVDGSCTTCNAAFDGGGSENRSVVENNLLIQDRAIKAGETFELPIHLEDWEEDNNFLSFALEFDPAYFEIVTVNDGALPNFQDYSFNWDAMDEGLLRCVWLNNFGERHKLLKEDAIIHVVLKAKTTINSLEGLIKLKPDLQDCSIVTADLEQNSLGFEIIKSESVSQKNKGSVAVYPNPSSNEFNFVVNLEAEGSGVLIEIFGTDGRRLFVLKSLPDFGQDVISIPTTEFPSGLLTYRISADGQTTVGKIVKK